MGSELHGGARDRGEHSGPGRAVGTLLRPGGGEVGGVGTPPEMGKESGAQGRPEQRPGAGQLGRAGHQASRLPGRGEASLAAFPPSL